MSARVLIQPVTSNHFTLTDSPDRLGWLVPTDPAQPRERLLDQYQTQGYLWLKGILDPQRVLDFRRRYFEAFAHVGLLEAGTDPADGIYSGGGKGSVQKILAEIVQWASYEAFCLAPEIWQFYEKLLGGPVYLHKRKLIRATTPDDSCTGAHYDLTYLRAGTDRVCTSWIPIGDIPVEMGGLVYLEGSDALGRQLEAEFSAKNSHLPPEERISAYNKNMSETGWLTKDLPALANRLNSRWLLADYETGDMVVHSPYMIHASTTNTRMRMRLSTDIRYQLVRDAIDPRWTTNWSPDDKL
ncbi:MAG: phytanoyl-CoA dioxygenase family protein [Chloroflexi bacterium]|nr:phytanoyl-CoA dioxygenase family protein [Chloroflexota bacterium]MCC6893486.1 phytanoyl-CoA dioxygenase family protein [Anaerolineae bacterium]